jgi:hypothetical protein
MLIKLKKTQNNRELQPLELETDTKRWKKQLHGSTMAKEHEHKPKDESEVRFCKLEVEVSYIIWSMALLMAVLESKLGPFAQQHSVFKNKEMKEDLKLEKVSSSSTSYQSSFKLEAKVDIKPYEGEVNTIKPNHRLQQLEVYFIMHNVNEE